MATIKSIEEKAKAYDEAIERAKGAHNSAKSDKENGVTDKITEYTIQLTETIFPELKESEDEVIRKCLIKHFGKKSKEDWNGVPVKRILAWLEKQGKNNMGISEATKQKLEDNLNKALEKETPESWNKFLDGGEQKPAWSKKDEYMINFISEKLFSLGATPLCSEIKWLKSLKDRYTWKPSDLQMEALDSATENCAYSEYQDCLRELIAQLKKLKE